MQQKSEKDEPELKKDSAEKGALPAGEKRLGPNAKSQGGEPDEDGDIEPEFSSSPCYLKDFKDW